MGFRGVPSATDFLQNFCKVIHFPLDAFEAIAKSGIFSFAISILLSKDVQHSLIMGGVAATASLIHALTRPLFEVVFLTETEKKNDQIVFYKEVVVMVLNLGLTQLLVNYLTPFKVNAIGSALLTVTLSLFVNGIKLHYKLSNNLVYIIV